MSIKVNDIQLVHRIIAGQHVLTSPDVLELHVSHADERVARNSVQSALDMLSRMKERTIARAEREYEMQERLYA